MTHPLSRDIPIEPKHTALLFVDVQKYNCTWNGTEYAALSEAEKEQQLGYFFRTMQASGLPNMALFQITPQTTWPSMMHGGLTPLGNQWLQLRSMAPQTILSEHKH